MAQKVRAVAAMPRAGNPTPALGSLPLPAAKTYSAVRALPHPGAEAGVVSASS